MENASTSPIEKRTKKPYMLLKQKEPKKNAAPMSIAVERSYI